MKYIMTGLWIFSFLCVILMGYLNGGDKILAYISQPSVEGSVPILKAFEIRGQSLIFKYSILVISETNETIYRIPKGARVVIR